MDHCGTAMQMLSNIPKELDALRASNDYGASLMRDHPTRFGFLAALPTDNPTAALAEIERASTELHADGFAVTCCYNGVYLSDRNLDPIWTELNRQSAVVFCHPNAYAPATQGSSICVPCRLSTMLFNRLLPLGRPAPVLEVAFETTRTVVDMLYAGTFRRFPNIKFIIAHCGAALPTLSGRLLALGTAEWVPNEEGLTQTEMRETLAKLYLDTAAQGWASALDPALQMVSCDHLVYGTDHGVPCSDDKSLGASLKALLEYPRLTHEQIEGIGRNALNLFPSAAARLKGGKESHVS